MSEKRASQQVEGELGVITVQLCEWLWSSPMESYQIESLIITSSDF
jgi:hypothetical protein